MKHWFMHKLLIALSCFALAHGLTGNAKANFGIQMNADDSFVFMSFNGLASDMAVVGGAAYIETDDPDCIASPGNPCQYTINFLSVRFSSFTLPTTEGTYDITDPAVSFQEAIEVTDIGLGLVIPAGTLATSTAQNVSGPMVNGGQTGQAPLDTPVTINLDIPSQTFSLEGEVNSNFGSIQGIGSIVASGDFFNSPPSAAAVADGAGCGQAITLDATGSTDPDGDETLVDFIWSVDGMEIASGEVVSVDLDVGTHEIGLEVVDEFMASDTTTITVSVLDAPPAFTFVPGPLTTTACGALDIGEAQATDPCGGMVVITNDAPAEFVAGVHEVTWTATTSDGSEVTAVQLVEVQLGDDASCCPGSYNVIEGDSDDNDLVGTSEKDCILGRGGQDTISGGGGDDLISGGDGDDTIDGGSGNDSIFGGSGQDEINGGDGDDLIRLDDGDDWGDGGPGDDTLSGGQGQDHLSGGSDNDLLIGNDGDDFLDGGEGANHLAGGGLHDTCLGTAASNTFTSCETLPNASGTLDACGDGIFNGTETDLDCGGGLCSECQVGLVCFDGGDCTTNICSAEGLCEAGALESSALQAALPVSTDWGGGYCVVVEVTNPTSATVSGWSVELDTNQSTIYTSWNGEFSAASGLVTVAPAFSWNQDIAQSATNSSIGFCANRTVPGSDTLPFVTSTSGG